MRWTNDEAEAVYEKLMAAGTAILEAAARRSANKSTPLSVPARLYRDSLIAEMRAEANAFFAQAAKFRAAHAIPEAISVSAEDLLVRAA